MSGRSSTAPLSETSVDRELETALAVQPSPEFLARVRARIANEPPPQGWQLRWAPRLQWAPLWAVLGVIIVAAAVVTGPLVRRDRAYLERGDRAVLPSTPIELASNLMTNPESRIPQNRMPGPESRIAVIRMPTLDSRASSEFLVSQAESEALWRAVVSAREGHIVVSSETLPALDMGADLQPPPEIVITPITIDALVTESGNNEADKSVNQLIKD